MKRLIILFCVMAFVSCTSEDVLPHLKYGGLRGNVAKIRENHYTALQKFGETIPDELTQITINEFNTSGNIILFGFYDEDGVCYFKAEYGWEGNNVCSEKQYYDNNEKPVIETQVLERSKNGIKWIVRSSGEDDYIKDQLIDNLIITNKDKDGQIESVLTYDKKGRVLEQKQYSGSVTFRVINEYNNKGELLKQTMYQETGDPSIRTHTYSEYDKKGNWTTDIITTDGEVEEIVKREITYR